MDIPDQLQQVVVSINENRFKTASKELTFTMMKTIVSLSINAIDVSHTAGYVGVRCLDKKMVMIRHQAVADHLKSMFFRDLNKYLLISEKIFVINKHTLFVVATLCGMMRIMWYNNACFSWHTLIITRSAEGTYL